MPIVDWLKEVPGYREAIESESRQRDIAWLNLTETINGVEVLPFTPNHFLILSRIIPGSPFICGGQPCETDVPIFLWVVSPQFIAGNSWRARVRRHRFVSRCRKLDFFKTCDAIAKYIDSAFMEGSGGDDRSKSYFSCIASLVDSLASEYGWSEEQIRATSFKRLFQLFRSRQLRHDPEARLHNASDRIRADHEAKRAALRN